tara:strand:+ start:1468 stop:2466 length:999 start_codon:yes stop_codon:yes gene_type:complete
MSKGKVEYGGADLAHFYKKIYECSADRKFDIGYTWLTQLFSSWSNCNAEISFIFELIFIVLVLATLHFVMFKFVKKSDSKRFILAVITGILLYSYFITGTKQYIGSLFFFILCACQLKNRSVLRPSLIAGMLSSVMHVTSSLATLSFLAIKPFQDLYMKHPKRLFLLANCFIILIILTVAYFVESYTGVKGTYLQKFNSYTAVGKKEFISFSTINLIKFTVLTIWVTFCLRLSLRKADRVLCLLSLNFLFWIVIIIFANFIGFIGYLTSARLIAIPTTAFLIFSSINSNNTVSRLSFLMFNVLNIKAFIDYINYDSNTVLPIEVILFSFWGV